MIKFIFSFLLFFTFFDLYSDENKNFEIKKQNTQQQKIKEENTFYKKAYSYFRKIYNGAYLTNDEMIAINSEKNIPQNDNFGKIRKTNFNKIKYDSQSLWIKHENQNYDFNFYLYRVYDLYSPRNFLKYELNENLFNDNVGIDSGYRRFDIFKKDISKIYIYDTKQSLFKITSCFDLWIKGFLAEAIYNISIHKNWHIGGIFYIPILSRFYNKIALTEEKDNKEEIYYEMISYLFFYPFYIHNLYKSNNGKHLMYINFSRKVYNVNESGGCKCTAGSLGYNNFAFNSCNLSIYDHVTTRHTSTSIFFYNQYEFKNITGYAQFLIEYEDNESKIEKKKIKDFPKDKKNEHEKIQKDSIAVLGLSEKIDEKDSFFKNDNFFLKNYLECGIKKKLGFLFLNFFGKINFKIKDSKEKKNKDESFFADIFDFIKSKNKKFFIEPVLGLNIIYHKLKISGKLLLTNFKKKINDIFYGNVLIKYKNDYFKFNINYNCNKEDVFFLENFPKEVKIEKKREIFLYISTTNFKIKKTSSFKLYSSLLSVKNGFFKKKNNNKLEVSQNYNIISIFNPGVEAIINILKYFYVDVSMFILKKFNLKIKNVNDERSNNLPFFNTYLKIYYKRNSLDKSVFVSYGLKFCFNSVYVPNMFDVWTQQWYDQPYINEIKNNENLPFINLFFTCHIINFNITIEINDLVQIITKRAAITAPYYPKKPWSPFNFTISYLSTD